MFKHRTTRKCGESEGKLIKQSANCCLPKWMSTSVKASPLQGGWAANSSYSTASAQTGGGGGFYWWHLAPCARVCVCVCLCVCVRRGGGGGENSRRTDRVWKKGCFIYLAGQQRWNLHLRRKRRSGNVCVCSAAHHTCWCVHTTRCHVLVSTCEDGAV